MRQDLVNVMDEKMEQMVTLMAEKIGKVISDTLDPFKPEMIGKAVTDALQPIRMEAVGAMTGSIRNGTRVTTNQVGAQARTTCRSEAAKEAQQELTMMKVMFTALLLIRTSDSRMSWKHS